MRASGILEVYVIAPSRDGPCKIGRANNSAARLRTLQTGNHEHLTLFHARLCESAISVETRVHSYLHGKRRINEWFDIPVAEATAVVENDTLQAPTKTGTTSIRRKEYLKLKARERRARQKVRGSHD